ncbi:MAG: undecaprenyl-diphosphate phosphatase [Bacilli bacterium]
MNLLELMQYILLAVVQGISEVLPISSSGHLALLQAILNTNAGNEAIFALLLHVGSLFAFLLFFLPVLLRLLQHLVQFIRGERSDAIQDDMMLMVYLVIATIPTALAGYLIKDWIDTIFQSLYIVGVGFYFTASLLILIPRFAKQSYGQYNLKNTLMSGLGQVLGILPGVSRSGVTLLGALFGGLTLARAKEFAFLLFIPITLGSFVVSFDRIDALDSTLLLYASIATVIAGIVTYITLRLVFKYLNLKHFPYFAMYLFVIGTLTIALAAFAV